MDNRPIGVFDSGLGGLTVLKRLGELLDGEDIVYLGDTARIPYGTRSKETVVGYLNEAVDFFKEKDVKLVVIACNTATALALDEMKASHDLDFIGVIEPGARSAVERTKDARIAVIGTEATIKSGAYRRELEGLREDLFIEEKACPLFVHIVEEGWADTELSYLAVEKYLGDIRGRVDSLILGCTHYPALEKNIRAYMGEDLEIIDPAYETALRTKEFLEEHRIQSLKKRKGIKKYYVTHNPDKFKEVGSKLLGEKIDEIEEISL